MTSARPVATVLAPVLDDVRHVTGAVQRVRPFTKGWSHWSWRLDCVHGPFVAKVPRLEPEAGQLEHAAEAMRLAAAGGVRAPAVVHIEECSPRLGGASLMVQEFIPGRDMEAAWTGASASARHEMLASLGRATAVLHGIHGGGDQPAWTERALQFWQRWADIVRAQRALDASLLALAHSRFEQALSLLPPTIRPALAHRDLYLANALTTGRSAPFAGLIDFEYSSFVDPMFDFVKLRMWVFERYGGSDAAFLSGYRDVRAVPDDAAVRTWVCEGIELLFGIGLWATIGRSASQMARDYRLRLASWVARGAAGYPPVLTS